jgi:hypothetical protein
VQVNSATIALETNATLAQTHPGVFNTFDAVFLSAFMVEIALKWYCDFWGFWKSGWNLFDLGIVLSALLAPGSLSLCAGTVMLIMPSNRIH